VFNCPEKGAEFVATEPLSSNGRSIIRLLGATPQYYMGRSMAVGLGVQVI
jgi:hypothetical protein